MLIKIQKNLWIKLKRFGNVVPLVISSRIFVRADLNVLF